jgi:hypothetical protein
MFREERVITGGLGEAGEAAEIADRLEEIAERLAELSLKCLREALDVDRETQTELGAEEKRLSRARRSVEKAAAILRGA